MDEIITPNLASLIAEKVRDYIIINRSPDPAGTPTPQPEQLDLAEGSSSAADFLAPSSSDSADTVSIKLGRLESAFNHQVLYIIGKEQMRVKAGTKFWRKGLLKTFLWIRENTRTKIASLKVPTEKVIEVGFVKDV